MLMSANEKTVKMQVCSICDVKCSNTYDMKRHLLTAKHSKKAENAKNANENCKNGVKMILQPVSYHNCGCGKQFLHASSLSRHIKTCAPSAPAITSMDKLTDVILHLAKQNQEFKDLLMEQNKKIGELSQTATMTQINNNTTNHNKFNLNVFLNETCKDAMNIMDFANSLEIKMKELEDVGTLGYSTGISNIIIRGLTELEVHRRPIHCSDLKRESMHVKDQNIWALDKDKSLLQSAIKRVARKNILKVQDWKQANPEYSDINSKAMDTYSKILIEATGSFEKEDKERDFGKIVRAIAKEVIIDKYSL